MMAFGLLHSSFWLPPVLVYIYAFLASYNTTSYFHNMVLGPIRSIFFPSAAASLKFRCAADCSTPPPHTPLVTAVSNQQAASSSFTPAIVRASSPPEILQFRTLPLGSSTADRRRCRSAHGNPASACPLAAGQPPAVTCGRSACIVWWSTSGLF
jgi:hypothetical protein